MQTEPIFYDSLNVIKSFFFWHDPYLDAQAEPYILSTEILLPIDFTISRLHDLGGIAQTKNIELMRW